MRRNRIFALIYRIAAFLLCLFGILSTLGVFAGMFSWKILLFYTTESNIIVLLMFGYLAARTAVDIKKNGVKGPSSYGERLSAVVTLSITVTLLIFWGMLAPIMSANSLFSYLNLQIHGFTPLLMILDYFLFAEPGKMKKQDPWLFAAIPLGYFAQSTILGFAGMIYEFQELPSARFPYFFVDFDQSGAKVFLYVAALTVFFIGLAYLLLFIDKKRAQRRLSHD
jgi:hypothetical protein